MAEGPYVCIEQPGSARIFVADSVTYFIDCRPDDVIVCGSHGGETAALFGAASGAKGLVLNDAGGGKEDAGISGLAAVEAFGVAAATVDYLSARIGSGDDTWTGGIISRCNRWAQAAGVRPGQSCAAAARLLAAWTAPESRDRPPTPAERPPVTLREGRVRAVALDSASMIDQRYAGAIVITGSHGGATAGRAVRAPVAAAFFNDAGVGKDQAGISRLPLLDRDGIPGGTAGCWSARIGDGRDTYESGVLSHVNQTAQELGLAPAMAIRPAVELLMEHLRTRM
jgi:hypothetical protein